MRTTNKEFKIQVQEHILEILSADETVFINEQLKNVVDGFLNWYSPYERKMTPNIQEAFKQWLKGLPSELNIEFEYYKVTPLLKSWYENCNIPFKEKFSSEEYDLYLNLVYREFQTLCKIHNVPFKEVI